ncbi:centromere binding protein B [Purpureocillium lavendulum]|uniref:Centromere binding protein B n=1 Tax=Purpureocillium lavendulum TaxID=1247861 RepID=A0AB34G677_9HYPO|nr:centromere binding protein B [Purpureocillium lavendulum]
MNTDLDGSAAMDQDPNMAQSNGYGSDNWVNLSPYSQSPYDNSPMHEYAGFGFVAHGMPSDPLQRMPPPGMPPQPGQTAAPGHQHQHQHHPQHQLIHPAPSPMAHHQLPMLNTTWPSQLTNPTPTSSAGSFSNATLSMTPASSGPSTTPAPPSSTAPPSNPAKPKAGDGSKPLSHPEKLPRKTLSAEQKRAMCLYHDENPGTKQADIGAKFGVERSTVSKVLRHRDQYLKREQDPDFAVKRAKGKHPDFDRTLGNYVRRQQQRGFDIKDDEIMEQAKLFAHASAETWYRVGTLDAESIRDKHSGQREDVSCTRFFE